MSKHDQEINILKEEMNKLKSENVKIYDHIQATVNTVKKTEFMNENTKQSVLKLEMTIKSLKTLKESTSNESVTVNVYKSGIEDPTENWLHCEICIYKCKREKTRAVKNNLEMAT